MEAGGSELAGIKDQLLYSWVGAGAASPVTFPPPGGQDARVPSAQQYSPAETASCRAPPNMGPGPGCLECGVWDGGHALP